MVPIFLPATSMLSFHFVFKMVAQGGESPDPSNRPEEQFISGNVGVIVASSSESEEEEMSYNGYEALPQEIIENNNSEIEYSESQESSSDEENDINIDLSNMKQPPSFDESTRSELTKLWDSSDNNRQVDIVIDSLKEEQIKNAMAGFKLPSTAIPSWAAHVPEEEWKEQLKNKIALLNKVPAV